MPVGVEHFAELASHETCNSGSQSDMLCGLCVATATISKLLIHNLFNA